MEIKQIKVKLLSQINERDFKRVIQFLYSQNEIDDIVYNEENLEFVIFTTLTKQYVDKIFTSNLKMEIE